jgi:UDP:flavonoid glycosyltransferase YjiC (YdhE family)
VSRVLVVATAGAGGDLQPLVAVALALQRRGHEIAFVSDEGVRRVLAPLGIEVDVLPANLDLGPRLATAVREGMTQSGGDPAGAGPIVLERMAQWATETAGPVTDVVQRRRAEVVLTSLFGVEVLQLAAPACPWAVVNSTFYIGPNPPRPLREDCGPRAVPLLGHYASLLVSASLVLHATDQIFDFGFDQLPPTHHYVGPLGIWEPPSTPPAYLGEQGDPWVLLTISSQLQDDVPLAQAALTALADRAVRVAVTVGGDHVPADIGAVPVNARVEQTISHAAVLERGILMISHAGHGSVMKALSYGRPMVLVPWGRDQPGVAARAEALGVASVVQRDRATPDQIAAAVDSALDAKHVQAARRHGERLRAADPGESAAVLIEQLL